MNSGLKELILKAFEKARASGKPDWHRMTTAVLKNRLIQTTQGAFRESEFGAKNMLELVEQAKDIVTLDKTVIPPVVELVAREQAAPERSASHYLPSDRIRPDLWQAVMDYSSGNQYVWDVEKGTARPRVAEDPTDYLLPTITPEEDRAWRRSFVEEYAGEATGFVKDRLTAFVEHSVSPKVLPYVLLVKWNDFVKGHILETLTKWFEERKILAPDRLVVSVRRPPRIAQEDEVGQLRDLIIACVKSMTPQELATVALPPTAVIRARKDKSGA
jgi:hypothetical protein